MALSIVLVKPLRVGDYYAISHAHHIRETNMKHGTSMRPRNLTAKEVILYYAKEDSNGCWIWQSTISAQGYGRVYFRSKQMRAHRLSYEAFRKTINPKLELDHICRVRECVSPFHLREVTQRENTLCGESPAAKNAVKTHCLKGHEFTKKNTYWYTLRGKTSPHRACNICRVANVYAYRRRLKEKATLS